MTGQPRGVEWGALGLALSLLACGGGGKGSEGEGEGTDDATAGDHGSAGTASDTVDGTVDGGETESGEPPPVPVATIAELLVPFDTNTMDVEGPAGWSTQYGKSPEIVAVPWGRTIDVLVQDYAMGPDGRAFALRLEPSADDYVITSVLEPPMLDRIMGFARDPNDVLYVATGINETDTLTLEDPMPGQYRSGIVRVVKVGWDGTVQFDTDLDLARQATGEAPELLINPMVAATSRLAFGGNAVALVHGINTDTDWAINARHQKALTTHLDASTGDVTRTSSIWVSHSFDQRMFHDGTGFVELHLGDAYPRDVVLARVAPDSGSYSLLAIKGPTGANNTFTRLGNAALIDGDPTYGYLALFATEPTPGTDGMIAGSRELGVVRVRRDFETVDPAAGMHLDPGMPDAFDVQSGGQMRQNRLRWLTSYQAEGGQSHAERPKLVPLGSDAYAVLWERWDAAGSTFAGTWGMVIDATGATLAEPAALTDAHLPRGDDAFALDGEAAWITGDATARQLHVHVVDAQLAYRRIVVE
jgi:hypothetical protein